MTANRVGKCTVQTVSCFLGAPFFSCDASIKKSRTQTFFCPDCFCFAFYERFDLTACLTFECPERKSATTSCFNSSHFSIQHANDLQEFVFISGIFRRTQKMRPGWHSKERNTRIKKGFLSTSKCRIMATTIQESGTHRKAPNFPGGKQTKHLKNILPIPSRSNGSTSVFVSDEHEIFLCPVDKDDFG